MTAAARSLAAVPEWWPPAPFNTASDAIAADPLGAHVQAYRALGPVYRVRLRGGEALALAGLDANSFIWANGDLWDYHNGRAHFREQIDEHYLSALDGEQHRTKRRQMQAGFRTHTLLEDAGRMCAVLNDELSRIDRPVDLRRLCKRLVVCMAGRALTQVDLPAGFEDEIAAFEHDLLAGGSLGAARHEWYLRPDYLALKQRVLGEVGAVLERRAARPPLAPDALSRILDALPDTASRPDREEQIGDLAMLLLAGSESTAHVILWALLYLYDPDHVEWLARVRTEVAELMPERIMDEDRYPVLNAVAREVERLRPPFPLFTLIAGRAFNWSGVEVPAGTTVLHPISLCHFLDEIFPQPWEFRPERWLEGAPAPKGAIGLFGGGIHLCLGLPLARIELALAIAVFAGTWSVTLEHRPSFRYIHSGALSPSEASLPARLERLAAVR